MKKKFHYHYHYWHYKGRLQILLYWLGFSTQVLKLKRHFLSTSNSNRGNWDYVSTIKLWVPRKCLFKCWVNIPVPSFGNIQVPSFGQPIKCLKKVHKNSFLLYQWRLVIARVYSGCAKKINEKNRTQNVKFGAVLKIYTILQNLR